MTVADSRARRILTALPLVAVLALVAAFSVRQVGSPDLGFHLRAGEHILGGNGFPRTDPFTFTVGDHEYVDTSWGFQVLAVLIERAGGAPALVVAHAALLVATFFLLHRTMRVAGGDALAGPLLLWLGAAASEFRFEVRPEVWSFALLAGVLHVLQRHAAGLPTPLWLLPVVQLVWVNVHGLFALGLVAIGCFGVGLAWRDRRFDRPLWIAAAGAFAVSLLNPYGLKGALFPLTLATRLDENNPFSHEIGEFFSLLAVGRLPNRSLLALAAAWALVGLAALSLVRLWGARRHPAVLLVPPALWLALEMVRNVPVLFLFTAPGIAFALPVSRWIANRRARSVFAALIVAASCLVALRALHDAHYVDARRTTRTGWGFSRLMLPIEAAEFAKQANLREPMLNDLRFGGYFMWALDTRVFIDGRLEVMGERFYGEYVRALTSPEGLRAAVERYGIDWIAVAHRGAPELAARLEHDRHWRLAHADALAAVWVAREAWPPGHAGPLAAPIPRAPALDALPGLGGPPRRGRLARWLSGIVRRERYPAEDFERGQLHYFRADMARAAAHYARAIEQSRGAYVEMYDNLGAALWFQGRREDAARCFRVVLEERPDDRYARTKLDELGRGTPR